MNTVSTSPVSSSRTIFPPVTTVPATSDLCCDRNCTSWSEYCCSRTLLTWNGGPASEIRTWFAVCLTSVDSCG